MAAVIMSVAYYPRFIKFAGPTAGGLWAYPAAAECMLRGETPLHCKSTLFVYPPFFALLMTALVSLPVWLRELVWYLVLLATLVVSLQTCEALARSFFSNKWSEPDLVVFRILTFVLVLKFILATLANQAYDSLVLLFGVLGLLAALQTRTVFTGMCFGAAAALKSPALIFLPYLLFKQRFAASAICLVVFVVLSLLPDLLLPPKNGTHILVWLHEVALAPYLGHLGPQDNAFWIGANPLNQSLHGAMARLIGEIEQPRLFSIALYTSAAFYVAVVGITMLKSRKNDRLIPVDGALLFISMLVLSPVSSTSHFVELMLPYTLLAAAMLQDRSSRVFNGIALALSMVLALAASDLGGQHVSELAHWVGTTMLSGLVLVAPLARIIWTTRQTKSPGPATVPG